MRVLVVTPWFPSAKNPGAGVFNLRDVRLLQRDHEVSVLHLCAPEFLASPASTGLTSEIDGLSLQVVPFSITRLRTVLPAARRIRQLAAEAEVLHTMAMPALVPATLARIQLPWVHTEHYSQLVTPPASRRAAMSLGVLKRLFRRPDETIAVSAALAGVLDRYRHSKHASTVIGNEVMVPLDPIRKNHDDSRNVHLIGVGGLVSRKGPVEAVNTMIELRRRGVDANLTWVGDGELRSYVTDIAAEAGVLEHLRLTGYMEPEALSRELLDANLFLLPVETETFGVAIAEALTHGLPVVVTGTGGHEEFLNPESSRLVDKREPKYLADAVQDLLADTRLPDRLEISRHAISRFSNETRRSAYLNVYKRAVRQGEGADRLAT